MANTNSDNRPTRSDYMPTAEEEAKMSPREIWEARQSGEQAYQDACRSVAERDAPSDMWGNPNV